MTWSKDIKRFLSQPKVLEWLDQNKIGEIYEFAYAYGDYIIGELSSILLEIGYNPLNYLDTVPTKFGINSTFTTISIPSHITGLEAEAFKKSKNLQLIELPSSVNYFGSAVFQDCPELHTVNLSNSTINQLPRYTFFKDHQLTNVKLPESLVAIQSLCFAECSSLKHIDLPSSLQNIAGHTFNFTALESIVIPKSVLTIGVEAFANCSNLKSVIFEGDPIIQTSIFNEVPNGLKIEVPKNSKVGKLLRISNKYDEVIER